ncbi:hypothetical protein [Rickettsia fournieri]|uniref:hypothetical protein n=1 Tax=Rickettsia fournieri TaxID=1436798 RepID=UPI001ADFABF1|nr:hypothetical protein [Rickettsia fournieri]
MQLVYLKPKTITEKNITDAVQNNFNAKMKVLIPNTKDFSKEAIVKFLNIISDEKVEGGIKRSKSSESC